MAEKVAQKFDRSKPHISIGGIGHVDHGKTTLIAAITKYLAEKGQAKFKDYGHADYIKNMITGAAQMDGAIVVVAASDSVMDQTKEHLLLAKQVGIKYLVIFINKADVSDTETMDLTEMDIRENLAKHGFDKDNTPVIRGSALCALEGKKPEIGRESLAKLLEVVDNYIPTPQRNLDAPFKMYIEDVFTISGRGTVVTGKVEQGILKKGEEVEISGLGSAAIKTTVTGIEMYHKELDEARAGDDAGINLRGVKRENVKRGQLLSRPSKSGENKPCNKFIAKAYILSKEERGRHTSFQSGYCPQFYFGTADTTGRITLVKENEENTEDKDKVVEPGSTVTFRVELIKPVVIKEKQDFIIREGGNTVTMEKKLISQAKKNLRDYKIIESFIAGIVLTGNEIKSLRNYQSSINEAYVFPQQQELYIINMHVAAYKYSHAVNLAQNHDTRRRRKLLLKKKEINKIIGQAKAKSYVIIPLKLFFNDREAIKRKKIEQLEKRLQIFTSELEKIRSNRISLELIGGLMVEYQGEKKMIKSLASLRVSPSHELIVRAFDSKLVPLISKVILNNQLGYKVERSTKEEIYFTLLPTTAEIREGLIRNVKMITEEGKKSFRLIHQDIKKSLKEDKGLSQDQKRSYEKQSDKLIKDYQDRLVLAEEKKIRELNS
ncbi:10742_t:CDS:2 [Funneliformis geosporum]|uniref:Elongation factor Tu, mitochondrial n=1 Tax=Funneliformis geosporum TaxID=1117311 RepID=A0A9W4SED9_9GLOM|nr:10742_t:CDS:2 [Funneliformis geosporum]